MLLQYYLALLEVSKRSNFCLLYYRFFSSLLLLFILSFISSSVAVGVTYTLVTVNDERSSGRFSVP